MTRIAPLLKSRRLVESLSCDQRVLSPMKSRRLRVISVITLLFCSLGTSGVWSQVTPAPQDDEDPKSLDRVTLSLAHYSRLQEAAQVDERAAQWREASVRVDFSHIEDEGDLWIEVTGTLVAPIEKSKVKASKGDRWAYLGPHSIHPLQVWIDEVSTPISRRGGSHAAAVSGTQKVRLRYPVHISKRSNGGQSALIPLPPIPSADLNQVNAPAHTQWAPQIAFGSDGWARGVALSGALSVRVPSVEAGRSLQRVDFDVSLHASGEGADVALRLEVLLKGGAQNAWIPIAADRDALLSAQLDGKRAIVEVRGGWHMVWVEGTGAHSISARARTHIDRTSGQPRLSLSPQRAPLAQLTLTLPGEREVTTVPPIPLLTRYRSSSPKTSTPKSANEGEDQESGETKITGDLPPLQELTLRWTEKRATPEEEAPEFLAQTYQLFNVQEGLLKGRAQLELDIMKGEVKQLEVAIPENVVLYEVTGAGVEGWVTLPRKDDERPRRVKITFGTAQSGHPVLSLKWQRVVRVKEPFSVPMIRPLGVFQESGVIALYDGDRVGFTPAKLSKRAGVDGQFTLVGQEALPQRILQLNPGEKVSQAFRHVQSPSEIRTTITTERARELRFDAQIDTLYTVREGAVRAQAQLLVNLKSGRLDALTLTLPTACAEPQVTGPSINRVEPLPQAEGDSSGLKRYLVRFTRRLEGAITLNVDAEQLLSKGATSLEFPRLGVEGAELTQGHLGLTAEAGLELTETHAEELRSMALEDLPRSIRLRASSELLYGHRFSRTWTLKGAMKRHKVVETLSAQATSLSLTSYLLESGQRVDWAKYTLTNQDRRSIRLTLPEASTIQEVLVDGVPVRARAEGASINVPIPKRATSVVELKYGLPKVKNASTHYKLLAPRSDVQTTNIEWLIAYSADLRLRSWEGPLEMRSDRAWANNGGSSFSSLNMRAHFNYDLLPAEAEALTLSLSLGEVLPQALLKISKMLCFLLVFIISIRRGWSVTRGGLTAVVSRLEYISGGVILVTYALLSYEKVNLNSLTFSLIEVIVIVGGGAAIVSLLSAWVKRRNSRPKATQVKGEVKGELKGEVNGEAVSKTELPPAIPSSQDERDDGDES